MNRKDYVELIWNGKEQAIKESELPTNKKLISCKEESKDFDTTQNLYIEGDNLDALKLLKKEYQNKIKMIYIDPPYNTGNKFIYSDNLSHADWLNMIYPRLKLARDLLTDDGVIFISIDDNEQANLKKVCDEIFGEGNFVGQITWRRTDNQPNIGNFARVKEYIDIYSKNFCECKLGKLPLTEKAKKEYRYNDARGLFRRAILLHKTRGRYFYPKKTKLGNILEGPWMVKEEDFDKLDQNDEIYWTENGDGQPYGKIYLNDSKGQIANDFWGIDFGTNQRASLEVEELFNKRYFDFPKPVSLLNSFVTLSTASSSLILDFFSGSGTTAHAVMKLNAEDGGNRKFIMVQLPEVCAETSEAYKAGYKNICEIGKERIRRAGQKIKDESPLTTQNLDVGFRVLKIVDKD